MRILGCIVLTLALAAPSGANAGCPEHSHEVSREDTDHVIRHHCKCDDGYGKLDGKCDDLGKARTVLKNRYRNSLLGMQSSLQSFSNELLVAGLTGARDTIEKELIPSLITVLAAPEAKFATAAAQLMARLTAFMREGASDFRECRFANEGLKTSCQNAQHFRELSEKSHQDLLATFDQ